MPGSNDISSPTKNNPYLDLPPDSKRPLGIEIESPNGDVKRGNTVKRLET